MVLLPFFDIPSGFQLEKITEEYPFQGPVFFALTHYWYLYIRALPRSYLPKGMCRIRNYHIRKVNDLCFMVRVNNCFFTMMKQKIAIHVSLKWKIDALNF